MSSLELGAEADPRAKMGTLYGLLDPALGHFVWAVHFLVVYIATAVACVLGLGAASAAARTAFLTALAVATLATAALLVGHALRRYRQQRGVAEQHFRMAVTIGNDAIATVGVLLQFFPILLVPVCA